MGEMSFISASNCERRILYCSYQFLGAHSSDFHIGGRGWGCGWFCGGFLENMQWGGYFPGVHPTRSLKIHSAENAILPPCEIFCSHTFLCRNSNLYKHHTIFQYICTHGNEIFFLENCSLCKTKRFLDMCHVY